jgi:penicillin G amidase
MVPAKALATALQEALGDVFRHGSRSLLRALLRRSLPALDGVVELSGLEGPVEVLRDRFRVPQVFAGNERDLFFAQGYVHAQDRFFQMELGRRAGQGRLSELIGGSALEFDRLSRTLGFGRVAAASEKNGPPETLEILESYSAGVNACLTAGPLPPELRLLRLLEPEPWTSADTAAWSMIVAWSLSASWELKLLREAAEGIGDWDNLRGRLDSETGSNAWAVSPRRSASGSALLAGDPHLVLGIPCLWYEVGLYGGPYHVVGASLPGTPGVVIGHNEEIAWSVTAALTDVQDLYVERFKEGDASLYEHASGWREAEVRIEEIPVRGRREPVVQRVRTTIHGPVITDVLGDEEGDLALRWATPDPLDLVEAGLAVNRARNKEEFLDALQSWTVPNQNFVYADRSGVIGKALAGPIPIRNNHRGDRPVPGWDGEHEWEGFLPFEKLPKSFDPEEGYVASANEAPEGDTIPGAYLPGYRKDRIGELLWATDDHTLETFREIQSDLYCAPAHALARRLAKLNPSPKASENLLRELSSWDGSLTAESRPGAVARVALEILLQRGAGAPARANSTLPTGAESHLARLVPELLEEPDDLPEEALREALREAVEILEESCGSDPGSWSWGALHEADLRHPLGRVRVLRGALNRGPYPAGGDANTVRLAAFGSERSEASRRPLFGPVTTGPNYRFVVDTGDWGRAWSMVSPGQSGHPASANYDDQIGLWRNVRYRPMVFGRENAELAAKYRLVLKPGASP